MTAAAGGVLALGERWRERWPEAVQLWSRFTRLRNPELCTTTAQAKELGLEGSFAMIRLTDQTVVIDLEQVSGIGIGDLPMEVMGHEVGHHVLCPATLRDQGRMIARMRRALPSVEHAAPVVANLYADLHINDRLQRSAGRRMDEVYRRLRTHQLALERRSGPERHRARSQSGDGNDLWRLYMRIYEILWSLLRGELAGDTLPDRIEGDAQLGSRLVRAYRADWINGAGGFAAMCLPYLLDAEDAVQVLGVWADAVCPAGHAGRDAPDGLVDVDAGELDEALHPSRDPRVTGEQRAPARPTTSVAGGGSGQRREPFEYGDILRALGLDLSDHEVAVRYYREAARPYLLPFPSRPLPRSADAVPAGFAPWTVGEPFGAIDWLHSLVRSPVVVPGLTTVQRVLAQGDEPPPRRESLDLDLYVDSSGSMPDPQVTMSFLALAGAVVALSCLRAGGRVQATLWSGAHQFETTPGFVTDADAVLRVVTGYIGGGTAFPLHVLRDTYTGRPTTAHPVHVLVISDDGVTTILDVDERFRPGGEIAREALAAARGGGTMVLNLPSWRPPDLQPLEEMGWVVESVSSWDDLVGFAQRFSRRTFGDTR